MDADLKDFLQGMEQRLMQHVDEKIAQSEQRLEARIEARIAESEQRIEARILESEQRTEARILESEQRMKAHAERVETALLGEFWKWARTVEIKSRQQATLSSNIDERLYIVEERQNEFERRVDRPDITS